MGNNSVPKFIFRLSMFPVYSGSVLCRFYCTTVVVVVVVDVVVDLADSYTMHYCDRFADLSNIHARGPSYNFLTPNLSLVFPSGLFTHMPYRNKIIQITLDDI
jgi:hypothetical protein